MDLLFEKSVPGKHTQYLPTCELDIDVDVDKSLLRESDLNLPELSEIEVSRHYSELERQTFGVNNGMYMLGSCTMKYNPQINEIIAGLDGFSNAHPLSPDQSCQASLGVYAKAEEYLCEITGMDEMTFQPAAGAHGELCGLMMIKAYHESNNEASRSKILIPDAAHGTNPASAAMVGYDLISIPVDDDGFIIIDELKKLADSSVAGLMLTNPNTEGQFEKNILEVSKIVHDAGGINYYDGANLNAIMGIVRPGDMGFDIVHLNLHKTFSTPHGGGGPGACGVGVKKGLAQFLPGPKVYEKDGQYIQETPSKSIGKLVAFNGNFANVLRALTYVITLGREGISYSAKNAVLNANYMKALLSDDYDMSHDGICMHEFVMTLKRLKKVTGVSAKDIAKGLLDFGLHAPTMYFPLTIEEALMVEPTETESQESMQYAVEVFKKLKELALENPEYLLKAPYTTYVRRPDELEAARKPILSFQQSIKLDAGEQD